MKIGVTGYRGRLGSELVAKWGCFPLPCDITDPNQISESIRELSPDVVINCAAYTAVDACEKPENYKRAIMVNTRGVEYLRRCFPRKLIHISTDYVFDGKRGPYIEDSKPNPINAYGFSKYGGEELLRTSPYPGQTFIVRTTGLYGVRSDKGDFASLVVDTAYQKGSLRCVTNLLGNQTYIPHLAEALIVLAAQSWKKDFDIVHIASDDVLSRYDFALMLSNHLKSDYMNLKVIPIKVKEMETWVADRPVKGGLITYRARRLKLPIFNIMQGIRAYKKAISEI